MTDDADACILGHAEATPRFIGFACSRHYRWIDATLVQIEELFALRGLLVIPGSGSGGIMPLGFESAPPGRLDIMAITDRRAHGLTGADGEIPDLPGALTQWARMVVEEMALDDELSGIVAQSVRVLRRERKWIVQQPWVDLFAEEMGDLHRALARATGAGMWPQPIGHCPNCGAAMYPTIGVDEARCRRCRTTWRGRDLARLRLIHEQEAK